MNSKLQKLGYLSLFLQTLMISLVSVGGGYVMIPLLRERFSKRLGWIAEEELDNLIAIGQSAPGALIINSTALTGYRLLGFGGAVCCAVATALPAVVSILIAALFYEAIRDNAYVSAAFRGMRAGVAAIIADAVVSMAAPYLSREKALYFCIMAAAFLAGFLLEISVAYIIIACALMGLLAGVISRKRGRRF
jgi:chromate transporter